jgi:hypothetical protein
LEDYYNYHRPTAPSAARPLRTPTAESPRPAAPRTRGDRASGNVRASPTAFTSPDYVAITAIPARG